MNAQSTISLRSGHTMPVLGLGTWRLTNDTSGTIATALQLGYRMIDTASDYGTQPGVGDGLRRSGFGRDQIYIITKVEETDDAYAATRKNLDELQLGYADLVLIHRPPQTGPGLELWRGLIRARTDGLTRDIGVSNYSVDHLQALIDATGEVPAVNQIEWSPFGHSDEMLSYAQQAGIVIQAYSSLTHGTSLDDPALTGIATKYGKTPAQVLIRWNLQQGTVPILKAARREHLEQNLDVFNFDLSLDDMAALNRLNRRYSSLGSLPYA